jgi:ubiquinone/menaquinone biosynthesis C-methylase UbiE
MQSTHAANPDEWSKLAKQYNTFAIQLTRLHSAEALRLLNLGKEDRVVLDVAAGTGAFALQAAQELQRVHASDKDYKVLATDFAEAMVAACRTEAHDQGLSDIVECKQMDGQVTSIPSFFHRVTCSPT